MSHDEGTGAVKWVLVTVYRCENLNHHPRRLAAPPFPGVNRAALPREPSPASPEASHSQ